MAAGVNDDNDANMAHNRTLIYESDPLDPIEYGNVHNNWNFYSASIVCPISILGGVFANILAFIVLVRGRLWLKHEGYVYLAANFCVNVGILSFRTSSIWITSSNEWVHYYPPNASNFMCKVWHFLMTIFNASGWVCVALLFNVYLREHLIHRRRCGCPIFAAKYCTLFASKIILCVIFSALLVLGVPYLAIFEFKPDSSCYPRDPMGFVVTVLVDSLIMWVLPFVFFLPIILVVTLCTKREGNTFGFSQIEERSACDEQMRVMAVTLSSINLFSHYILTLSRLVIHVFRINSVAHVLVELGYSMSIASQPILCFIILKALRDGFRSQLRNIRCCRRVFPSLDCDEEAVRLSTIQEDPPNRTES